MASVKDNVSFGAVDEQSNAIRTLKLNQSATRPCPHNASISCSNCRLNELCLPIALDKTEIHQLDEIVQRNRPLKKGDHLYRQNDPFKSVYTAEARIVSFILSLSSRYSRVSLAPDKFLLHMTRGDIGEFLSLTFETVSRTLTSLQKKEVILVKNREIEITDFDKLRAIASK